MQFIRAEKKDIHRIVLLAWNIWPEWYWPVIGPEQLAFMLDAIYNPGSIENQMEGGQEFFILSIENADAGFLAINQTGTARLEKLYLKSEYRKNGIGTLMLNFAAEQVMKQGHGQIQLNVNRFNPALSFYLRKGFEILRQEDIPFGPFFLNDFILFRDLNGSAIKTEI
jgi:GNAT superfamily N-acetyltransferase